MLHAHQSACHRTQYSRHNNTFALAKKTRVAWLFICFKTPCTYPGWSYLESLHSDAHRVPYLCPTGGHEEFRTLRSSWKERGKNTKKRKVIVLSMENKSYWTPVLSQRERDKYNFLSIKVTGQEARDLQVLSSKALCWIYSPLERKGTKLGRYSLLEENGSASGGVWRQWDKGHSES